MGYTLICNRQARPLLCKSDLTPKQAANFDYVEDDYECRFALYRGEAHDVYDTQRIEPDSGRAHAMGWAYRVHPGEPLAWFDSIETDSYFSATVFRLVGNDSRHCRPALFVT